MIFFLPASDTSIKKCGLRRWKFVISPSIILNLYRINENLCPTASLISGFHLLLLRIQSSAARGSYGNNTFSCFLCIVDQLRLIFFYNIEFRMHMVAFHIINLYRAGKVPETPWRVTWAIFTPFSFTFSSNSFVKCKPAVGAAADPSFFA